VAFVLVPLLALVVLLVSVRTPVGPTSTTTVAPSFDGPRAAQFARRLAQLVPDRAPGSATAKQAADDVAGSLSEVSRQTVRRTTFTAPGPDGRNVEMENVWVIEPGTSTEAIVLVANRDDVAPGPGLDDNATGTAAIVELARDLAGVDRARALVVASTDGGTVGQAVIGSFYGTCAGRVCDRLPSSRCGRSARPMPPCRSVLPARVACVRRTSCCAGFRSRLPGNRAPARPHHRAPSFKSST
jgi:hypothetical protein